jgi:membrane associated rhomboid family serine protease
MKQVGLVTVTLFVIGLAFLALVPPETSAFYYDAPRDFLWYLNLITHMLSHGNMRHLLGNFIFGFPYMMYAEYRTRSSRKFLALYALCGFGALSLQWITKDYGVLPSLGVIGSSGAIFGIVGYALADAPAVRWLRCAAFSLLAFHLYTQASLAWGVATGATLGGVAYAAHLGGILTGIFACVLPKLPYRSIARIFGRKV